MNNTIEADVKGRADLVLALIHCFLGIFDMPCSPSNRSLWPFGALPSHLKAIIKYVFLYCFHKSPLILYKI